MHNPLARADATTDVGVRGRDRYRLRRRPTTLRRAWAWATMRLVLIILVLGVVSVGAAEYQHRLFARTTTVVEGDMAAMADAQLALVEVSKPAAGLMYRLGESAEAHASAYADRRARLDAAIGQLERGAGSGTAKDLVASIRRSWAATDAGVLAARDLSAEEVAAAFAAGTDPFEESMWQPYNETVMSLAELGQQVATDLQGRVEEAAGAQRLVLPVVFVGFGIALAIAWATARMVTRRVVAPLVELRRGAIALRDSERAHEIDLTDSVTELQDIARVFNETAASLRQSHGELRHQARTDVLTELPNRAAFGEDLRRRIEAEAGPVSVLFIDLDDFKVVNDSLGHAAGDELLRVVAARIGRVVRDGERVCRLGGDEFAVAIDGDAESAAATADRILDVLGHDVVIGSDRVKLGCSIGVSSAQPGSGLGADDLARQADFAMYMAKGRGKNCQELFSPAMHADVARRAQLKEQLADAVRRHELVLHYQPVVAPTSGAVLGFEALVRWDHPERGLLAPVEFVELAEQTGAIIDIGAWVVSQACADLASFHRRGGAPGTWVSVNVASQQLVSLDLVDVVRQALQRNELDAAALLLEITESAAITNQDQTHRTLDALRQLGTRVALDDFGTGFSSLHHLHELPVDVIKIDRSFISDLSTKATTMIETVIDLAAKLGLAVIAEGVENEHELERFHRHAGLGVQGYHFARPAPAALAFDVGVRFDVPDGHAAA